jgi:hypothetical protein
VRGHRKVCRQTKRKRQKQQQDTVSYAISHREKWRTNAEVSLAELK